MATKRVASPTTDEQLLERTSKKKQVVDFDPSVQEALDHILSQFKAREERKKLQFEKWMEFQG